VSDVTLLRDWDDLAGSLGASPFVRPGWIVAWADAFGQPVEIATAGDGGVDAIAAVIRRSGRIAAPVNAETPEYSILASAPESHSAIVGGLVEEASASFEARKVSSSEGQAIAAVSSRRFTREVMQRSPYLDIAGEWDGYESSLGSSFRQGLRRKARRLSDEGAVSFESHDGTSELESLLEEGFTIESSAWKAEQGTAISSSADTRAFYTDVARWAADRGWLRMWFVRLDGRPLAFRLDLEVEGVYYHLKGGYEPSFSRFSPGLLLQHESVKHAFSSGARRYEFLGADEPYKLNWTKTCRDRVAVRVFGRGPRGTAEWFARAVARPALRRLKKPEG
jgi:CelD/BcsL family acetyltransferase involved in cellulose biosynthesis